MQNLEELRESKNKFGNHFILEEELKQQILCALDYSCVGMTEDVWKNKLDRLVVVLNRLKLLWLLLAAAFKVSLFVVILSEYLNLIV